jgi:CheY-like chemotaxis protein
MAQKLLLADDSVTIQRVIELTFADENIDVVAVSDGDQAIARIESDPPDIVLADIGMPGRDGYEVAAHVKGSPRLMHIPVLLLTGAFEPVDQSRAAAVGSDGVLAKPFEPQLVIARVKELLAQPSHPHMSLDADLAPPPAPAGQQPHELDEYFDRLDAAFANLSSQPQPSATTPAPATPAAAPDESQTPAASSTPADIESDWFSVPAPSAPTPRTDLPLSYASPAPSFAAAGSAPHETAPAAVSQAPVPTAPPLPSVAPTAVPSLADAFAAILAAEQTDPAAGPVSWPAAPAIAQPIGDEVVEEVVRRVLERLSDRVVRETAGPIVSTVAERLVREEIERIKSSLR